MLQQKPTATKTFDQQINFFTKVIGNTLKVFGGLSVIAQIALLFLEPETRLTTSLALLLSLGLFWLGTKKVLQGLVKRVFQYPTTSKLLIFSLPVVLTLLSIALRIWLGQENWKDMNTEGGFIEYGTSLAFLLAAVFAGAIAKASLSRQNKLIGYSYCAIALGLFLIGMEEISWGQILLGFESSDFFQTHNSQQETTLHNLFWVNEYLDKGLMLVSFIAGVTWLIYSLIGKFKYHYSAKYFIPSWYLASYFLTVSGFFYLIEYIQTWNDTIANFQEYFEFIFSLGCFLFILTNFFKPQKITANKS